MEKTFSLDQKEQQMLDGLTRENDRLKARGWDLDREQKEIDRRIAVSDEQNRSFLRQALSQRGIEQCELAQIINGQLVCRLADQPNVAVNGEPVKTAEKVNGLAASEMN